MLCITFRARRFTTNPTGDFIRLTKRVTLVAKTKKERHFWAQQIAATEFALSNSCVVHQSQTEFAVIKRIELINFMSHKHTVFEPSDGLTVLVGPNNCGKSAVVTALQILAHNDSSTYVLRHGEKECRIIVETDDGHRIEWSRGKNKSPVYLLNGKPYDRLKGNVPEAVKLALRMPKVAQADSKQKFDIHFGTQKDPVFLVKDRERAAAEFFSASSDAGRLMEMQALHRQKTLAARKDQNRLITDAEQLEFDIDLLEPVLKLQKQLEKSSLAAKELETNQQKTAQLEKAIRSIKAEEIERDLCDTKSRLLAKLTPQPAYHETQQLADLIENLETESERCSDLQQRSDVLSKVTEPPQISESVELANMISAVTTETRKLKQLNSRSELLRVLKQPPTIHDATAIETLVKQIDAEKKLIARCKSKAADLSQELDVIFESLQLLLEENPLCPTCNNEISAENLLCHSYVNATEEVANEQQD